MSRRTDVLLSLSRTLGAGAVGLARPHATASRHSSAAGGDRSAAPTPLAAADPRWALPAYSFVVSLAIIFVSVIAPDAPSYAAPVPHATSSVNPSQIQSLSVHGKYEPSVVRDGYRISKKPAAPAVGMPDPGSAQAIAYELIIAHGWDDSEYSCLVALWNRESHWNTFAMNPVSGAYGIPQALPGDKMASAGADWATNPETQIRWGIGYILGRYGTPCGAWEHSEQHHWY